MFRSAGINSSIFELDVSNFDTSKVTNMSAMFYYTGYYSPNFTLKLGEFDTSSATNVISLFQCAGNSSSKINFEVTIRTPNTVTYSNIFSGLATVEGAQVIVNYIERTESLVDLMIATKSSNGNIVKGEKKPDIEE
jgi:surface protein